MESIHSTLPPIKTSSLQTKWMRQVEQWSGQAGVQGARSRCHCDGLEEASPLSSPLLACLGLRLLSKEQSGLALGSAGSIVCVCSHKRCDTWRDVHLVITSGRCHLVILFFIFSLHFFKWLLLSFCTFTPHSLWDPSFLNMDQTWALGSESAECELSTGDRKFLSLHFEFSLQPPCTVVASHDAKQTIKQFRPPFRSQHLD